MLYQYIVFPGGFSVQSTDPTMGPMGPMGQLGSPNMQMNPLTQMAQMNPYGQPGQMPQMGQMPQIGQMGQMGSMGQNGQQNPMTMNGQMDPTTGLPMAALGQAGLSGAVNPFGQAQMGNVMAVPGENVNSILLDKYRTTCIGRVSTVLLKIL